jgi:hypothetical protein
MNPLTPTQQEIALRAYHLYLEAGCPNGSDWDHWFRAEQELGAKFFTPPAAKAPAAASPNKSAPAVKTASAVKAAPAAKRAVKKTAAKKAPAKKAPPKK